MFQKIHLSSSSGWRTEKRASLGGAWQWRGAPQNPTQIVASGEVEPQQLVAEANVHQRGRQIGVAVRALVVFETGDRRLAAVHQQRALPAKSQRLAAQGGTACRQSLKS